MMGSREKDRTLKMGIGTIPPECLVVREEVLAAVFSDGQALRAEVLVHLEKCGPCREWETEVRKVHGLSRSSGDQPRPSLLIEDILASPELERILSSDDRGVSHRRAEKVSNRALLAAVFLSIFLFHGVLAFFLGGRGTAIQGLVLVAMLTVTMWVYLDSAKRSVPIAFWTALQPFTLPLGLVAYLVWRAKSSARCPGCGRWIPAGDAFCHACGTKLMQFCCGCGRPVRKCYRVCPNCGTPLEECFPLEDESRETCGWSPHQIGFVIGVNAALLAGFLACVLWGGRGTALIGSFTYLLGYAPIFNWVSFDSRRRAMATVCWGLLVVFTLYVGLLIYLASRWDARIVCPVCGSYPPVSFNFCPCCGSSLGHACLKCGASISGEGVFCATCGEKLTV